MREQLVKAALRLSGLRRILALALAAALPIAVGACRRDNQTPRDVNAGTKVEPAPVQQLIVAAGADEFGLELNRPRLGMYPLNASI